jgi:hypothetical protein
MLRLSLGILVLALLCVAAAVLAARVQPALETVGGGAARPERPRARQKPSHLVVDTLNLAHWLRGRPRAPGAGPTDPAPADSAPADPGRPLEPADIVAAIDATAATLKKTYPGQLVYVLKDRESRFNEPEQRQAFQAAAQRNQVTVALVERYQDPPAGGPTAASHSARGRDDFYMSILAHRLRCPVLTADRLRDFADFRAAVPPFHVLEFTHWRAHPARDFVRPASPAYARLRRPATVHPSALLGPAE